MDMILTFVRTGLALSKRILTQILDLYIDRTGNARRTIMGSTGHADTPEQLQYSTQDIDQTATMDEYQMINKKLIRLKSVSKTSDVNELLFLLSTVTSRAFGSRRELKVDRPQCSELIDEYIREIEQLIDLCLDKCHETKRPEQVLDLFKNIRHAHGSTALLLSGGGTFGIHHCGVVKCLFEHGIVPKIISGSSSGAILAAMICTRLDSELYQLFDPRDVNLDMLKEPDTEPVVFPRLRRLFSEGVVFDTNVLTQCIRENIGDVTFVEAYNRSGRILNVTVTSSVMPSMSRLLNYITSPNVVVWSAVVASCAIPRIFKAGKLLVKNRDNEVVPWCDTDEDWIDGSLGNDVPIRRLAQMFNVTNTIVSQVNPHVVPFLKVGSESSLVGRISRSMGFLVRSELRYRLPTLIRWNILPTICGHLLGVISQQYEGDVTIVPESWTFRDLSRMFSSPDLDTVNEGILKGEQVACAKVSLIKQSMQIESKLDRIISDLKTKSSV